MTLDRLPDLDPDEGEVIDAELALTDDALVKVFALGPGASIDPHDHPEQTNVFHVVAGTVTVLSGDDEERIAAPGVVLHERGTVHGARNDTDAVATFTATLTPTPQ